MGVKQDASSGRLPCIPRSGALWKGRNVGTSLCEDRGVCRNLTGHSGKSVPTDWEKFSGFVRIVSEKRGPRGGRGIFILEAFGADTVLKRQKDNRMSDYVVLLPVLRLIFRSYCWL